MIFVVKLRNYPVFWEVEADNIKQATVKGWEEIRNGMDSSSIAGGGEIVIKERVKKQFKLVCTQ
jgi:hypothetical protein